MAIWIVERFSKSKKRELIKIEVPKPSVMEIALAKIPAHKRDRARQRIAEAEKAGAKKCPDCGIISGVFSVTFHKVLNGTKQVCQVCRFRYTK